MNNLFMRVLKLHLEAKEGAFKPFDRNCLFMWVLTEDI